MAVYQLQWPAYEPSGLLEDHQALSGDGGHRKGHHAPHPTALLCSPPAGERSRPASHSGDAGSCGYLLHTDIHPRDSKAAEGYLQQGSSQSMRDWRRDTSPPVLHPLKGRRHLQCFCRCVRSTNTLALKELMPARKKLPKTAISLRWTLKLVLTQMNRMISTPHWEKCQRG